MGDFLRLFSLNGAHLVAGVFLLEILQYQNMGISWACNQMSPKITMKMEIWLRISWGKKNMKMKEIGISWDMFPQKDSWLVNSQTCFSIRELQLIMHVDNIRSSSGLCTWMSFRKGLKTELSSALPNFAIEDSIRFSHLLYGRK